jgi:hypothetical protein
MIPPPNKSYVHATDLNLKFINYGRISEDYFIVNDIKRIKLNSSLKGKIPFSSINYLRLLNVITYKINSWSIIITKNKG